MICQWPICSSNEIKRSLAVSSYSYECMCAQSETGSKNLDFERNYRKKTKCSANALRMERIAIRNLGNLVLYSVRHTKIGKFRLLHDEFNVFMSCLSLNLMRKKLRLFEIIPNASQIFFYDSKFSLCFGFYCFYCIFA